MKQGGGGPATGKVAELINRDFGSYDAWKVRPLRSVWDSMWLFVCAFLGLSERKR